MEKYRSNLPYKNPRIIAGELHIENIPKANEIPRELYKHLRLLEEWRARSLDSNVLVS